VIAAFAEAMAGTSLNRLATMDALGALVRAAIVTAGGTLSVCHGPKHESVNVDCMHHAAVAAGDLYILG
jgi:hypothetical protein